MERRVTLFDEQMYEQLWSEATKKRVPKQRVHTRQYRVQAECDLPPRTVEVIRGLVEEGALAKAAKHLINHGAADPEIDPEIAAKLTALHPPAPPATRGINGSLPELLDAPLDLDSDEYARMPTGLQPCHLKDWTAPGDQGLARSCDAASDCL